MGLTTSPPSATTSPRMRPRDEFPALAAVIDYLDTVKGRADLQVLEKMLKELTITWRDVAPACKFNTRGYKRNTISRSEHYELLALCWRSGHCTPIHDHAGTSCAFKVIEGEGTEIRYRLTPSGMVCPTTVTTMEEGYVCAAEDADIHQVLNLQSRGRDLITLHMYSPPIRKMHTYDVPEPHEDISMECDPAGHEGCL